MGVGVTLPLSKRGGIEVEFRDTSLLCHNGRQGWWCDTSFAIRRGREEGKTQARQSIAPYICVSLVPCESGHVKTRRYKQDAKGADFAQGVYIEVHDQAKTQTRHMTKQKRKPDKVLHSIYAFRPNKPKRVTLKRGEGLQIASEAGRFGDGSVHNGYMTETNTGEGARCALIPRFARLKPEKPPSKRGDTSKTRRARILRRECT